MGHVGLTNFDTQHMIEVGQREMMGEKMVVAVDMAASLFPSQILSRGDRARMKRRIRRRRIDQHGVVHHPPAPPPSPFRSWMPV